MAGNESGAGGAYRTGRWLWRARPYVSQPRFVRAIELILQFIAYLLAVIAAELMRGLSPVVLDGSSCGLILAVSCSGGVLLGAAFLEMIPDSAPALGQPLGVPVVA